MKTALVTGAGRGIGLAAAHLFLRAGLRVLGLDKDFSKCDLPAEVAPGPTLSPMYERLPESRKEAVMRSVHSGRPGRPEEVAQAIVWLGTESPAYLNGATLDVNDGSYPR